MRNRPSRDLRDRRALRPLACLLAATVLVGSCRGAGSGVGRESGDDDTSETTDAVVFVPPAEGAAFGIPGTPPSSALNALLPAQAVGRLPGSGSVTKDGAYTYSIPIDVPPGRAGMAPALTLTYNSRGGDGLLGMGWSLGAGQSMIRRCGKTWASGYQVSPNVNRVRQTAGVSLFITEQLCLDGQKLEVVGGINGMGGSEYRTEVESFAKIVAEGAGGCTICEPERFKVYHKNGRVGTYTKHGGTGLTGLYRDTSAGGENATLLWALTKLEDLSGNAVEYVWNKENATAADQEQSVPRLVEIKYTSCTSIGSYTCPYGTAAGRKIKLDYEARTDTRLSYLSGARVDAKHRLKTVSVYGDAAASTPTWTYALVYKQSAFTKRSLLETVQQCAGADCLPKTTFVWADGGRDTWNVSGMNAQKWNLVNPGQSDSSGTEPNASESAIAVLDANGDGLKDVVLKEWPSTAIDQTTLQLRRTSDTMGTGPKDYLFLGDGAGYFQMLEAIDLEGDGFPQASTRCGPTPGTPQGEIADLSAAAPVDLDMDGRDELFVPLNIGCPFQWTVTEGGVSTGVRLTPGLKPATPDINTRGHRAFAVLNYDRTTSTMKKRAAPVPFFNTGFWDTWKYSFADLTGDALPEVLFGATGSGDAVTLARAEPTGTAETEDANPEIRYVSLNGLPSGYDTLLRYSWQPQSSNVRTPNVIRVLDENGDGRSEIVQLSYDGAQRSFALDQLVTKAVRRYTKGTESWTASQNLDGTGDPPANTWPPYPAPGTFVSDVMSWRYIDINGDGLKDAIYARKILVNGIYLWYYRLNTGRGYRSELPVGQVQILHPYGAAQQIQVSGSEVKAPQDVGMRFADMNGDGKEDLVLLDSERGSIMYSTGAGFEAPVDLPARASGTVERLRHTGNVNVWPSTQLADMDGDGLTDLLEFVRDPTNPKKRLLLALRRTPANGFDVVTSVKDGSSDVAAAESVEYRNLSDQSFHATDAIPKLSGGTRLSPVCRYPARCVSTGRAASRHQSFRATRKVDVRYTYVGARVDVTGRGWLGYRQVKALDAVTGIETVQTFDQSSGFSLLADHHIYPRLDTAKTTVTQLALNTNDSSLRTVADKRVRATVTWSPTFASGLPLRTLRDVTETVVADLSRFGALSSSEDRLKRVVDISYDQYGNPTTSTETAEDLGTLDTAASLANVRTTTTSTFTYVPANTSAWIVGLPETLTVTRTTDDAQCAAITGCASATQKIAFEYESGPRKLLKKTIREPQGNASQLLATILERDGAGLVRRTRLRDGAGNERVTQVDYEAKGFFPRATSSPAGHVSWLAFNVPLSVLDRATDPNGAFVSNTYDTLGRPRRSDQSDGAYAAVSLGKMSEGSDFVNTQTVTTATGADSKTFFDAQGRPTLVISPGFNPALNGVPTSTTVVAMQYDALGNVVHRAFSKLGVTWAAALTTSPASLRSSHQAMAEILATGAFDTLGRPVSDYIGDKNKQFPTEGAGELTAYAYPRIGESTLTDELTHETRVIKDARGNKRRVYQGLGGNASSRIPIDQAYGALGHLAYVKTQGAPVEKFEYDSLGRRTTWRMGGTTQTRTWAYTAFDEVQRATEANVMSVAFTRDALGRPLTRIEDANASAAERSITYEWDTSLPQGGGPATLGALAKAVVQNGHETSYKYDAKARPYAVTNKVKDGPSLVHGFRYDTVGRMNRILYPSLVIGGVTIPGMDVEYKWATNGQLRKVIDLAADPDVDLWAVTERHPLGMLKQSTNPDGFTTTWHYQTNTLRQKQQDITNAQPATSSQIFSYRANGLLWKREFTGLASVEAYGYGVGKRLTDYTRTGVNNVLLVDADYAYNNAGDILTLTTNAASSLDLGPSGVQTFGYGAGDVAGGGTGAGYTDLLTTIDPNTVGPSGTVSYGYDFAGRQTARFLGGVKKRSIEAYNTFNLPTTVKLQDGGTIQSTTALAYDAHGNRVSKKKHTESPPLDESVLYVGKLFEAQSFRDNRANPPSDVRRSLFRVFAEGQPIAEVLYDWVGGAKKKQYLYVDHQGSVTYRTDGGSTVQADGSAGPGGFRGYTPFGKRWGLPFDPAAFSSIGYTGHVHDDDLGLINMNGRLYDVEQHRFISRDPIVMPYVLGGTNAYSYVLNSPMNLTDPSGFCPADHLDPETGECIGELIVPSDPRDRCADFPFSPECDFGPDPHFCRNDPNALGCSGDDILCGPEGCDAYLAAPRPKLDCDARCRLLAEQSADLVHDTVSDVAAYISKLFHGGNSGKDDGGATDQEPAPAMQDTSTQEETESKPSSTAGTAVVEALAWLGGWKGKHTYVTNSGINYGAAGQFMAGLNDGLNGTFFSMSVATGLMSFLQPVGPETGVAGDLATSAATRYFWTGGDLAKDAAGRFATLEGGTTLGMTAGGRVLEAVALPWSLARPAWQTLSKPFAEGATGEVHVFIGARPGASSVWTTIEKPALVGNGVPIRTHLPVVK